MLGSSSFFKLYKPFPLGVGWAGGTGMAQKTPLWKTDTPNPVLIQQPASGSVRDRTRPDSPIVLEWPELGGPKVGFCT